MTPLTASETAERARNLLEAGRGAAWPDLLKLIETLSLNICEVTIPELAELIERDPVVLARVIAVANTLAHNPNIAAISTLTQAIHRIGYNRIRTVAISLMLLENAGASQAAAQRDAAALALCAGLMAQGAATTLGTHDPEFAFACAALRNFGRIMMTAVSLELSDDAARLARRVPEAEAFRQCFGLTPLALSKELLAAARLPAEVLDTLCECEPKSFAGGAANYDERLLGIADYGNRLAALSLERHPNPDDFRRKAAALGREFEALLPGASELAPLVLRHADERLVGFSRCTAAPALPTGSLRHVRQHAQQLASSPPAGPGVEAESPAPAVGGTDAPLSPPTEADAPDLVHPLAPACALAAAEDCWLFLPDAGGATFTLADGIGRAWTDGKPSGRIQVGERSIFGVATIRQKVLVMHDTHDPSIAPYLPAWWRGLRHSPRAFILIPLETHGTISGVLLAGWSEARRITIARETVERIRQHLAVAAPSGPARPRVASAA